MRFLLDTHAWLWAVLGDKRIGRRALRCLRDLPDGERVGIAAISLKEASWLLARGRVVVAREETSWAAWLREAVASPGPEVMPLTVDIAIESERLPDGFPRDPADRLIAATARVHDLTLLTADEKLAGQPGLRTLW